MNKFESSSINWSRPDFLWTLALFAAQLISYILPWIVNSGVGLTFNAYDLAEWSSLHPTARFVEPVLFTPFLLRVTLSLFTLAWILMLVQLRIAWATWLAGGITLIVAIALLPPLEFFTVFRDDINLQQQAALAVGTLLLGGISLSGVFNRFQPWLSVGLLAAALVTGLVGLIRARTLMFALELPVQMGIGVIGFNMLLISAIGWLILKGMFAHRSRERNSSRDVKQSAAGA